MKPKPSTPEANKLMLDGALALAEVEAAGMRIDTTYLDSAIDNIGRKIDEAVDKLKQDEVWKVWKRRFRTNANLGSRDQLAAVLFDEMGHEVTMRTSGGKSKLRGRPSTDASHLETVKLPFVKKYLTMMTMEKARGTYLVGLKKHVVDGYIRPSYTLHLVTTYRGACMDPNAMNFPNRDPRMAKLVRRAFIPRDGHTLLEIDLKQNEVRVACCCSHDERLTKDTLEGDMHRDWASELYMLPKSEVSKPVRHAAKNGFVFAQFYGDYWKQTAKNLWDKIEQDDLRTGTGMPLQDHLAANGIGELGEADRHPERGTFEHHVQEVEHKFWNKRYYVYNQCRQDWWREYQERGWFQTVTGFTIVWGKGGLLGKNQVLNARIQGPAFHCLLWALIRMVRWLRKRRMKSKVIGQIHDSLIIDTHKSELQDVLAKVKSLLVDEIREDWTWLTVPLGVEAEASETNWWEKKEILI